MLHVRHKTRLCEIQKLEIQRNKRHDSCHNIWVGESVNNMTDASVKGTIYKMFTTECFAIYIYIVF